MLWKLQYSYVAAWLKIDIYFCWSGSFEQKLWMCRVINDCLRFCGCLGWLTLLRAAVLPLCEGWALSASACWELWRCCEGLHAPFMWCLTSCFGVINRLRTKPAAGVKNELILWKLMSKKHWLKLLIKAVLPVVSKWLLTYMWRNWKKIIVSPRPRDVMWQKSD